MRTILPILSLSILLFQCRPEEKQYRVEFTGKPEIPQSIKGEHKYLLEAIRSITLFSDSTGPAAMKLYELLQHHFQEEEDYVLPPLGLLPMLAAGKLPEQTDSILMMTEKLREQLPHMIAEHQMVGVYIEELKKNCPW
jgi:hypothetical protein